LVAGLACSVRVMTVVDLHVREAGTGLPVVLLHAFPLSSAMWLEQRNGLGDAFRIITPDVRGFGGSQLGYDDPSLDHMADDVAALLDTVGVDRVVLGGLSMGGYVAMAFLRRHGDRVAGLLLADTKASADADGARANRHRIADALDESGTTQVLLDDVLPALMGETTVVERPMIQGRVRALVEDAPPAAAAWAQRAMAARPDSFDTLRTVTAPALVVAGEQDALSSVDDAHAMVDALPDARLVVVPRSGHLTAVEAPEAFNLAARDFLAALT
jgi:pimeloyl-ACP methyl ester carboxylesterase